MFRALFRTAFAFAIPLSLIACDKENSDASQGSDTEDSSGDAEHAKDSDKSSDVEGEEPTKSKADEDEHPSDEESNSESESGENSDGQDENENREDPSSGEEAETEGGEEAPGEPEQVCDQYPNPPYGMNALPGRPVLQYQSFDSYNEQFNLCEMAGETKILVVMSTGWCGPCQAFANYLATGEGDYPPVREAMAEGRLKVVEYMVDDFSNDGVMDQPLTFLEQWHERYPNEHLRVAYGDELFIPLFATSGGGYSIPTFALIDTDFKWKAIGPGALNLSTI